MPQRTSQWQKMSKKRNNENRVLFSLVPSPGCSCEICIMQASRGFVFKKQFNPHGGKNAGCNCKFMPGVSGKTQIEDYDPETKKAQFENMVELRNRLGYSVEQMSKIYELHNFKDFEKMNIDSFVDNWFRCSKTCGSEAFNDILEESKTRSSSWLFLGEKTNVSYKKPREAMNDSERMCADSFAENGFKDIVALIENGGAPVNIDFLLNGSFCEAKNVTSDSSISSQIGRTRKKFHTLNDIGYRGNLIGAITAIGRSITINEVELGIVCRLKEGEEILLVYDDLSIKRLKK